MGKLSSVGKLSSMGKVANEALATLDVAEPRMTHVNPPPPTPHFFILEH